MTVRVLVKDLDSLRRVYEPEGKTPEMVAQTEVLHGKGDEVIAHDGYGNEVTCTVRRQSVVVVPDWETYNKGVDRGQESML